MFYHTLTPPYQSATMPLFFLIIALPKNLIFKSYCCPNCFICLHVRQENNPLTLLLYLYMYWAPYICICTINHLTWDISKNSGPQTTNYLQLKRHWPGIWVGAISIAFDMSTINNVMKDGYSYIDLEKLDTQVVQRLLIKFFS